MRAFAIALVLLASACGVPPPPPDGGDGDPGEDAGTLPTLDLNDVSFLYPLPSAVGDEGRLPGLASAGARGALLPFALFEQVPAIVTGKTPQALYDSLRVVSARVDPCFPASAPPVSACIVQVRLVAQPLALDAGTWTTDDATLHLFYTLPAAELPALKARVGALRTLAAGATAGRPLDVHPVMAQQGLAGAYAKAVTALITDFGGDQNLTRVAFMSVGSGGSRWVFGAFNRDGATLVADAIPLLTTVKAQGFAEFGTPENRQGEMAPWPRGDKLSTLVSQSELQLADDHTLSVALASALSLENPGASSPKTADCVSCHVATRSRHNAEEVRGVDTRSFSERFRDDAFDLSRVDGARDDPRALRSFGYFGRLSALSQRTINESAAVARALSGP